MQKARRHPPDGGLRPIVSTRFQVLFTPLFGVLFTFPSRYWFTIGLSGVFSLTRWCWQIQAGFFPPLFRVLIAFPASYWFTIGLSGVFSLTRWCWQIQSGFLRSRPTQDTARKLLFTCTRLSLISPGFPSRST